MSNPFKYTVDDIVVSVYVWVAQRYRLLLDPGSSSGGPPMNETAIAILVIVWHLMVVLAGAYAIRKMYEPQDDEPEDWDAPVLAGPTAPLPPHRTFTEVTIGPDGKYVGTATPERQFRLYPGEEDALTLPRIYEPPEEGSSHADSR